VAIITAVVGLLGRFAGRVLSATLGWATLLLFGKVPQSRQTLLLVIVFGSLVWVALLVGVLVPQVGLILIAAVPLPDFIDESWVRLAMLIGAAIIPLLLGLAAVFVTEDKSRRSPAGLVIAVLRGYPFALALTLIIVLLGVVGTVRKLRSLAHRWEDAHIPLIVKPGGYDTVLNDVRRTLVDVDIAVRAKDAGVLLSGPPKLLDAIAGRALGDMVPDRLMVLVGANLEVLVYPSDLAISGTRDRVALVRAALASKVSEAPAYMTTSKEAQQFEDRLDKIRLLTENGTPADALVRLAQLDSELARLVVPHDEWEILYRRRLQLERDALRAQEEGVDGWPEEGEAAGGAPSRLGWAIGAAGIGLVALDLALLLTERRRNGEAK
jgi:hypothetical protein